MTTWAACAAAACIAAFLRDGVIKRRHPATGFLQLRVQRLEGSAVVRFESRERLQRFGHEGRAWIVRRLLGQSGQRIGNLLGAVDGVGDQSGSRMASGFIARPP